MSLPFPVARAVVRLGARSGPAASRRDLEPDAGADGLAEEPPPLRYLVDQLEPAATLVVTTHLAPVREAGPAVVYDVDVDHHPAAGDRDRDPLGVAGVLESYYLGIANYEQFQLDVSIDYLAMVIIGGLGSVLGSIFGAVFVTLLPIATRWALESSGSLIFSQADLANIIPSLRLVIFGGLIIFFLVVEPEGLARLWRNIRNYFRVWPFSY